MTGRVKRLENQPTAASKLFYPAAMPDLVACPFCREMFEQGEARACPVCGIRLTALARLPAMQDASDDAWEEPVPPHMEQLPWWYAGRGRALLLGLAIAGLAMFFAPWVVE